MIESPHKNKPELLLPNQWCKNAYNMHAAYSTDKQWQRPVGVVYNDLIPPLFKKPINPWVFLKTYGQQSKQTHLNLAELYVLMQQWIHRLLNLQSTPDDHALFLMLCDACGIHPALYPYWLYHARPQLPPLVIFPYQWQKVEWALFDHYHYTLADFNLMAADANEMFHSGSMIKQDSLNSNGLTMLMVPAINPFWLYLQSSQQLGIYHRYALKEQVIIRTLLNTLVSLDGSEKSMPRHAFKALVTAHISTMTEGKALTSLPHHALKQFVQHLDDMTDETIQPFSSHLNDLTFWINMQTANFYQPGPTMLVAQPHATPMFFEHLVLVNEAYATEPQMALAPNTKIHQLETHSAHFATPIYSEMNDDGQIPQPQKVRVTQFQQYQRCPIIHACQYPLKINLPQPSCTKRDLGIALHETLATIWAELKDQASLIALSDTARHSLIDKALAQYLTQQIIQHAWEQDFWDYQRINLHRVVDHWLLMEAKRTPFKVLAVETPMVIQHAGIEIHGRIDRIDEVSDLGPIIIDYKTGQTSSMQQILNGFPDPQMLVYTLHPKYDIQGIAHGLIYQTMLKGVQFKESDYPIGPVVEKPDALTVLTAHLTQFQAPLTAKPQSPRICQTCDFQSICLHAGAFK